MRISKVCARVDTENQICYNTAKDKKGTMSENRKNRWQKRRHHDVHDGDVSGTFCGRALKGIRTMVLNSYTMNPTRAGKHNQTM